MADTQTTTLTLNVGIEYTDPTTEKKKTSYIKIPNYKSGLTESQIRAAINPLITNDILRDTYGEPMSTSQVVTAYTEDQEVLEIDIGVVS